MSGRIGEGISPVIMCFPMTEQFPPESPEDGAPLRQVDTRMLKRFLGVIVSPREWVYPNMFLKGSWAPILLLAVLLAAVRLTTLKDFVTEYQTPEFAAEYSEMRGVTPEKAASEIAMVQKAIPAALALESPLMIFLGVGFLSMTAQLMGRFLYKQMVPFLFVFRMVAWSSLVSVFPLALNLIVQLVNPGWEIPSNVGWLLPKEGQDPFIAGVARGIDVFLIWQVALIAVGMSEMYQVPLQRTAQAVGTMFLVFLLANVILTAMP